MRIVFLSAFLLFVGSFGSASAWDNDDLEIFDLVELINEKSFYTLMGISNVRKFLTWIHDGFNLFLLL